VRNEKGRKRQERKKKEVKVRKAKREELLRKITVKIGLERIDT